jgi:hypothetical protein
MTPTTVEVSMYRGETQCYTRFELWRTSAPPEYDGFGSITLYDSGPAAGERATPSSKPERVRYVLIDTNHTEWHRNRYLSGLYSAQPSDALDVQDVIDRLWKAMTTGVCPEDA